MLDRVGVKESEAMMFKAKNNNLSLLKISAIFLFIAGFAYSCYTQNIPMKTETIQVKQDSVFSIRLSASFGEGYSWRLAEISDSTSITFIKMTQLPGVENKDGSCETQVFFFRGGKKGKSTLRLVYEQPWLKEKSLKLQYKLFLIIIN